MLTPHEGEFLRLGGDLSLGRERAAADFARRHGCVLVLKGPGTLVAGPEGRLLRNPTGNCGMAKGGSGDVLAGMVLSLIGQGAPALEAAACAVWLHGRAGDLCARDLSEYAMTPLDLTGRLWLYSRSLDFRSRRKERAKSPAFCTNADAPAHRLRRGGEGPGG